MRDKISQMKKVDSCIRPFGTNKMAKNYFLQGFILDSHGARPFLHYVDSKSAFNLFQELVLLLANSDAEVYAVCLYQYDIFGGGLEKIAGRNMERLSRTLPPNSEQARIGGGSADNFPLSRQAAT